MPTWHGHHQGVLRLHNTSPFLFVDLVVMKRSADNRFLEKEVHGDIVVHFDKDQWLKTPALDKAKHRSTLAKKLTELRQRFDLLQVLALKEVRRGNPIEAHSYYQACTLRPYVDLLRTEHSPTHHGFHTRYIHYELPPEVTEQVERLTYVKDAADIERCSEEIKTLFAPLWEKLWAKYGSAATSD